jgi:integrase
MFILGDKMHFIDTIVGRPNTKKTYKSIFYKWIEPSIKANDAFHWGEHSLKEWTQWLQEQQLSPRTIKIILRLGVQYVSYLGGPTLNPTPIIRTLERQDQSLPVKALTKDEMYRLLKACENKRIYLPIAISIYTGMRKGEVFGLKWGDIDLLNEKITVKRSYDGPTKNGKSRIIPISKSLGRILLENISINTHNYIEDWVFVKKFDPNPSLKTVCKRAGIKPISFHNLRHTFATLALDAGRNPKQVQEILGHSNVSTTLDIYWSCVSNNINLDFLE